LVLVVVGVGSALDEFRLFVKQLNDTLQCRIENVLQDIINTPLVVVPEKEPLTISE